MRVVFCSQNEDKRAELEALAPGWAIELLDADEYPPETGETYYENALAKARFGRTVGPADAVMLGEDSGIEVDGLGGEPGVRSARFAAGRPVERLLEALAGIEGDGRRARYVSEFAWLEPGGAERRGTGVLEGAVAHGPRGTEGFGYDPIFVPEGEAQTVAELGNAWKRQYSHRARSARALLDALAVH